MKKLILNILATTAAVEILLVITGAFIQGGISNGFIQAVIFIQLLAVNTVIHLGMLLTRKFENRYAILEYLLDMGYILIVLLVFGSVFQWYPESPWLLAVIAVAVYAFGIFTNMVRVRKDINDINKLLMKRKENNIEDEH